MNGGTQRRVFPLPQSDIMKIFHFIKEIEPTACRVYSHNLYPRTMTDLNWLYNYNKESNQIRIDYTPTIEPKSLPQNQRVLNSNKYTCNSTQ